MRFCTYRPQRQATLATPGIPQELRNWLLSQSNEEFANNSFSTRLSEVRGLMKARRIDVQGVALPGDTVAARTLCHLNEAAAEKAWYSFNRPYYNVYPVVARMVDGVKLSLRFDQIGLPFAAMLFQFSEQDPPRFRIGHLEKKLEAALWYAGTNPSCEDSSARAWIGILQFDGNVVPSSLMCFDDPASEIEECLVACRAQLVDDVAAREAAEGRNTETAILAAIEEGRSGFGQIGVTNLYSHAFEWCYRLLVLTSLLAAGNDLVTPILLAKDRKHLDSLSPGETDAWIAMRASKARQRGLVGFEVGRALQADKDQSPHFRNPHLALFHTGPGRQIPRVQLRRGSVVVSKALTKVPTGFLGPETPEEIACCNAVHVREPISIRTRFFILKRDEYRCQLCGASPSTDVGTVLHIDHKISVAKGGSSDISNLWVLCSRCNLGKGIEDL
jgi:5-methylcytosine-specific restriction endonuclease McrA